MYRSIAFNTMKRVDFKTIGAAAHQGGAMEPETMRLQSVAEAKNGASLKSHTSKRNIFAILTAILLIATFNGYAQKLQEGSLAFLKGQENLHIVFSFDDVKLQGKTEKAYLEMENPQWVEGWEAAKSATFMERLLEHLNKNVRKLKCGDFPEAQYQATVRVLTVDRNGLGKFLEGPGVRKVVCEVVFTKTGDPKPLAKITKLIADSKANTGFAPTAVKDITGVVGAAGSNTHLVGVAFGYIGQDLGKFMAKKIK